MRRGQMALAVALVAAAVGGAGAAHASSREVMVPSLPAGYPMVVATPDGGASLLGDEEPGHFGPRALWRIDPKARRPPSTPRVPVFTAVGYGLTRPIADNKKAKGRAANRRSAFVI